MVKLVGATAKPGRHCASNAIEHLKRASLLESADAGMAAFRAITAEEEASTALFHAIKRHKYPGAKALNPRNHVHKNAVTPFCEAVSEVLALTDDVVSTALILDKTEQDARFRVRLDVSKIVPGKKYGMPEPPLHFSVASNGQPTDFAPQLASLATERGSRSIAVYLRKRANERNRILYASQDGYPEIPAVSGFLKRQRRNVFVLLGLYLLVDPYPIHQLFVQQGLNAFLRMLNVMPNDLDFG